MVQQQKLFVSCSSVSRLNISECRYKYEKTTVYITYIESTCCSTVIKLIRCLHGIERKERNQNVVRCNCERTKKNRYQSTIVCHINDWWLKTFSIKSHITRVLFVICHNRMLRTDVRHVIVY